MENDTPISESLSNLERVNGVSDENDEFEPLPRWGLKKRMRMITRLTTNTNQDAERRSNRSNSEVNGQRRAVVSAVNNHAHQNADFVEESTVPVPRMAEGSRAPPQTRTRNHDTSKREPRGRSTNANGVKNRGKDVGNTVGLEADLETKRGARNGRNGVHGKDSGDNKANKAIESITQDRRSLQHNLEASEEGEIPKFCLYLTRAEKEADFFAMTGCKLPQRPKKRPKPVEKLIQKLHPGAWLSNLKRERYEVRERKISRRKARGLLGMQGFGSDSDED